MDVLKCAVKNGLLEAVKYLLTVTTEDTKINMASSCIDQLLRKLCEGEFLEEDENDICYFVFFEMTDYIQELVFNSFSAIAHLLLLYSSQYELCRNLLEERIRSFTPLHFAVILHMAFYTNHLEVVNDDDCRQLFIDVWLIIPTSFRSCRLLQDLGAEFLSVLIRDNFPFLLKKETFQKTTELNSLDLKTSTSVKQFDFHLDKWKLLHFLIEEEIVIIQSLESSRPRISYLLKIRQSNEAAWSRVLRFVGKVGSKTLQQKE
ncbi:hypothetical protein AVEN_186886-1 [Araneus ventricosus]|uniref:Uncharacterized protein n=1 Tax=Araneus ventricosus TaxID=182803 RepID=A0A4Y2I357_ARAVE|nr:hypothetical protein AVEN_186886-1 [Araneus ventricosus]